MFLPINKVRRNSCFQNGIFLACLLAGPVILCSAADSFSRDVSFAWTANIDDPAVDGYKLYYKVGDPGATPAEYNGTDADNGNPSPILIPHQASNAYTLMNLLESEKYSFILTAYRGTEESDPAGPIILGATSSSSTLNAAITADVLSGESPLPVNFDATMSTGDITLYQWSFGDGSQGTGSMVSHTYDTAGIFTVTLTVSDALGSTNETTFSINVLEASPDNKAPAAVISTSSTVGNAPLQVDFDGSSSTDPDGDALSHAWIFGDGGSASGALASHTYIFSGIFSARLTVTDPGGLSDSVSTPVFVSEPAEPVNEQPTAVIIASAGQGYAPLAVTFNGAESSDPDGNIVSYAWNFGDGTTAGGARVTHTFVQPAIFTVTLKVRDNNGAASNPVAVSVRVLEKGSPEEESLSRIFSRPVSAIINLLLSPAPEEEVVPAE